MTTITDFVKKGPENARKKSNKCVIYTRVSSKDQADNNGSLPTQMKYCQDFAQHNGFDVEQYFGGTYESAKSDENRKEFQRMLKYVNQNKQISAIIVYSLDRFSRTGSQASATIEKLRQRGVEVRACQQDFDTSNPSGQMMQNIMMQFARMDNEQRRQKCITGMQEKLRQGYWVRTPPKGYTNLNKHATADQHKLIINPEGKLIRKAFEMRAKGHTYREITEKLRPRGFATKERHLGLLMANPFYAGYITDKLIPEELIKGKHPAIVSEALFLKVNAKDETQPKRRTTSHNEELPLKTFAIEEESGIPFTGYIAKKGDIPYYKTRSRKKAVNINARKLNSTFGRMLALMRIQPELKDALKEKVMAKLTTELTEQMELEKALSKQVKEIEIKLESLEEKFVLDKISEESYLKFKAKYTQELRENQAQLSQVPIKSSNLEKAVERAMEICANPLNMWQKADYRSKQNLQKMVFPEGILVNKEKRAVRTERINTVIFEIARQSGSLAQKETGKTEFEIDFSRVVENTGVEPVTSCMPCKRSSQLS
jgi:site-specific DNA recombinase